MSPRLVVLTTISAALAVTVLGCGRLSTPSDPVGGSVYRLEIEPCLGLSTQRATAFAVVPARSVPSDSVVLVTAAHSLEEAGGVMVRDEREGMRSASVIFMDAARDITVLQIESDAGNGMDDHGFVLTEPVPDTPVEVPTFADIDGPKIKTGTITRLVNATLDGEGRRKAVELTAIDIEPGDSGAPVVNGDGEAVAMVFAAARVEDRAWAVSAVELQDALTAALDPSGGPAPLSCGRSTSTGAGG